MLLYKYRKHLNIYNRNGYNIVMLATMFVDCKLLNVMLEYHPFDFDNRQLIEYGFHQSTHDKTVSLCHIEFLLLCLFLYCSWE